jgi:membrane protein YqaA with SNARE-associated domain
MHHIRAMGWELGQDWYAWGLPGLFLASFLAATILPFSSEALLGAMALGPWSFAALLFTASVGNTLGAITNYALGRWAVSERLLRRLRIDPQRGERWKSKVERWGPAMALLCWLPVIGDPIALALGVLRSPFGFTTLLMFIGKAVRYAVVLGLVRQFMAP